MLLSLSWFYLILSATSPLSLRAWSCPELVSSPVLESTSNPSPLDCGLAFPFVFIAQGGFKRHYKLLGFTEEKLYLPKFWRLEIQSQGANRAMLPLKALGKKTSYSFPASGGCQQPLVSLACSCIPQVSVSICTWPSPVCVRLLCISVSLLLLGHQYSWPLNIVVVRRANPLCS